MKKIETAEWARLDREHLWHPFTQMKDWAQDPMVVIEKGSGNYLIDTDGKKYLDGVSSLWANIHGHRVRAIDRAVKKQLDRIAHSTFLGLTHPPAITLAVKLKTVVPKGLTRVFYSDSGAASVEVAMKMAFQYWQHQGKKKKTKFIRLKNAYHGDTLGATSIGGIDLFHELFRPVLFDTIPAEAPYRYRDPHPGANETEYALMMADKIEKIFKKRSSEICAIAWEPVMQGAAGMILQPAGYGRRLRELTEKYGVLLIADEVATGFGRTGKMFACEHESVVPDLMCVAKGITGGYLPLSATLTSEKIYEAFLADYGAFKAFYHGHTYSANPLACAAAIANLDLFHKNKTLEKLSKKILLLTSELEKMKTLPHVGEIRQAGFMVGIELVADRATRQSYPLTEKRGIRVCQLARRKGVMIRPLGNVVVLMPPLSISHGELKILCRVVQSCIHEVTG